MNGIAFVLGAVWGSRGGSIRMAVWGRQIEAVGEAEAPLGARKGGRIGLAWKMQCFASESWHVTGVFAGSPRFSFPNSPKEPRHVPTLIPLIPLIPRFPPIPTTGHLRQGTNDSPRAGEPCLPQGHRQAGIRHV